MVYHRHHIIPKHMGGTDDLNNLAQLTIDEHAEAHLDLYILYGRWQDKLAWLGLTKQIGHEERLSIIYSENAKRLHEFNKGRPAWNSGKTNVYSEESLERMGKPKTEEHIKKLRKPKSDSSKMGKYERTESTIQKLKDINTGKTYSPEINAKKSGPSETCMHCGKVASKGNIRRWHNDNCKSR